MVYGSSTIIQQSTRGKKRKKLIIWCIISVRPDTWLVTVLESKESRRRENI